MNTSTQRYISDSAGIAQAAEILRAGGLLSFPTETVYGLGADARNDMAVAGIFAAKGRPQFNPLIVHVADLNAVKDIAELSDIARNIAATFWPGPLTLVLPRKHNCGLSKLVTAGLDTVAVRIPAHPVARQLLRAFDGPIAAPSANPSGKISPTRADHVMEGLGGRIAGVLDGGACDVGVESTIIGFSAGIPMLLRSGGIPVEILQKAIGMSLKTPEISTITAPGQLKSHYAPTVDLRINADAPHEKEVWLGFGPGTFDTPGLNLSETGDLHEAAAHLFAYLHQLDHMAIARGISTIAVAPIPGHGLGLAINDRLKRAAAPRER
ncbi:MAG: L-threonylcarbamoyladenylate synthase [Paracoccaceae bacterium]